ncbi:MAG: diguanylate cyclase (GGDEF)-like protein/PAS domain S-box-containing protein [Phenylobacterium sp.]|jgi:diguanylate cyclase (GGDEF)-like protein/PAS domain S-box-containing protein
MMRQLVNVLVLFLAVTSLWQVAFASAVGSAIIVRQLTVEDGLSQDSVHDIFQDSYGFIWLATENGLNRYDGHQFSTLNNDQFNQLNSNNTLLRNVPATTLSDSGRFITSVSEDQNQHLWIGSDNGVSVYDPLNNTLTHLTGPGSANPTDNNGLVSTDVSKIIKHSDGTMWVATYGGLHHYSYQSKRFSHYLVPPNIMADANEIVTLAETPDGLIVLGTQNKGVLLFDPQSNLFSLLYYQQNPARPAVNQIHDLFFDNREFLWIGTEMGLIKYDFYHKKSLGNILDTLNITGLERHSVRSVTQDKTGNIWAALYTNGILSVNPRTNKFSFYNYQPAIRHGLSSNAVTELFFDNAGLLWLGSQTFGVSIYNPMSKAFDNITHQPKNNNSLSHNQVWSVALDHQDNLWLGTEQGLNKVSPDGRTITRYSDSVVTSNNKTSLLGGLILDVHSDDATNTLWLATNKGLSHFDPASGESFTWQHDAQDPNSLLGNVIFDLELDNRRQLWIASRSGLSRMDLATQRLYHYPHNRNDPHSLSRNTKVAKLFLDASGTVWIGTDNGINRYNPSQDNFDRFLYDDSEDYQAKGNSVTSINEIKRGLLWVGYTRGGIITLDFTAKGQGTSQEKPAQTPKIEHIGLKDGLPTTTIFGIIPDHFGSVWISTMSGLVQYHLNELPTRVFAAKEGLLGSEFNENAYNVSRDGLLYFGSTNGLTIVNPSQIKPELDSKHLRLTNAVISGQEDSYALSLLKQDAITLDHHANSITIQFSDFNYISPKQSLYAYQFKRSSDNSDSWIEVGNDNHITLHQLTTGRFRFNLRNRTGTGEWGDTRTITITITPPWWRTIYAYVIYLVCFTLTAYVFYIRHRARRKEKKQLHRQIKLFAEAFKNTSEGVMIMHRSRTIVAVNAAFTTITGYSEQEVIGNATDMINSTKHSEDFYEHIWSTLDEAEQWNGEIWQLNKAGVDIAVEMTISSVTNEEQQISHFVGVFSDITVRLNAEQELRKLAKYDSLTGLPNRTLLQDRLDHAINHGRREHQKLAVLFLDLDRFKHVNDSLGHDIGDLLLVGVAERILQVLRDDDTFARLGGDEFVIILEDYEELPQLTAIAHRVIAELAKPFLLAGYEVSTSTSIGISIYPDDGETSQHLLKNADTAMYHVKAQGRNNFQFYDESMNVQAFERLSIENELRRAIEHQQFVLHYQPRVNSEDGRAVSMEALIRWQHPERGLVAPGYFIDIAEDSGLIVPISEWVIREACRQLKTWRKTGITDISLSVNLSPRLFSHFDLVNFIDQTLQFYQVPPGRLELEITESMLMNDVEATIADLHQLNKLGCHISVDDFGTGYSSLSYLHRFPVHTLKIDRSFVSAIHEHDKGIALVDIIINLAHNLDLELVAEGVETYEQFAFLQQRAPMQIQGYYFAKPMSAEDVVSLLIKGFDISPPAEQLIT